ncbi:YHS domain-containing protein [Geobacter sp. FeAm09]|nr:YHS domain-containing protein [Geobacter sp. FeAm09]
MRLLMWGLLIYIGYRVVVALTKGKKTEIKTSGKRDAAATHRDPVCGVYVSEEDAVVGRLEGERHYFCSMNCLEKFREQLDHKPS